MNTEGQNLVIIQAHPDDAEAWSAGTLAILAGLGWNITIATLTAGGMGSYSMNERETVGVRRTEAAEAAGVIGADYACFNRKDGFFFDDEALRIEVVNLLRRAEADVVVTHTPFDYHVDHRTTCTVVEAATMVSTLPNTPSSEEPLVRQPAFYHNMPMNLTDPLGFPVPEPHFFVDITGNPIDKKMTMLSHHQSQIELMRKMLGMEDFFGEMKKFNAKLGAMVGVEYAECYWQHLGGGFPQDPVIQKAIEPYLRKRS